MLFAQVDAKSYYTNINRAELLICEDKYHEALPYYDSAFRAMPPWITDMSNAIQCAIDANDTARVRSNLMLLLRKGIRFVQPNTPLYNRIYAFSAEVKQIINSYDRPFLCQKVDTAFINELTVRLREDQYINRKRISMYEQRYTNLTAQAYIDSFSMVLLKNGVWLKDWILKNGYPKEECYYYPSADSDPLHIISILLVHYFSEHWTFFYTLKDCVYKGEYHPIELASHIMRHTPVKREHFKELGHYCYLFMGDSLESIQYNKMEEIEKNRAELLLQPYNDYLKKVDYYFKHGTDKYDFRTFLGVMNWTNAETLEKYLDEKYRHNTNN